MSPTFVATIWPALIGEVIGLLLVVVIVWATTRVVRRKANPGHRR